MEKSLAMAATAVLGAATMALGGTTYTTQVVADGLSSPRHMTIGPDGAIYIAEAGAGGNGPSLPTEDEPTVNASYGDTGSIIRLDPATGTFQRVLTLPSMAVQGANGAPASNGIGPAGIVFDGATAYAVIGLGQTAANRDADPTLQSSNLGHVVRIDGLTGSNPSPTVTSVADLAAYEGAHNPDNGPGTDSNLFDLTLSGGKIIVADAGGNDILSVDPTSGDTTVLHTFATRDEPNPFAPPGATTPMQAVPTTVTLHGSDLYVGQLTGFPFPQGGSNVYQMSTDGSGASIFADGFTNVTDLAFGPDGDLYVLEYSANGLLDPNPHGALLKVDPLGNKTTLLTDQLTHPTGLVFAPNGTLYIANQGLLGGQGQILKITAVPLPAALPAGLAMLGGLGFTGWMVRRRRHQTVN